MSARVLARWAELTATELRARAAADELVIVPVGSIEQHGPHLPVDTDVHIATCVAEAAARSLENAVVAPALVLGMSAAHVPLGGTISLRPETMLAVLRDAVGSIRAAGFRRVMLLNGHNGNKPFLQIVVAETANEHGVSIAAATYYDLLAGEFARLRKGALGSDAHGGELETSIELHLRPERVALEAAVASPLRPATDFDARDLVVGGPAVVGSRLAERYPSGVAGDPTLATAELGRALFEAAVRGVVALARQYVAFAAGRA